MSAVVGKRPVRGALHDADGRIFFFYSREDRFEVVHLYAEMIQPAVVAGTPAVERHADVSIAGYDGAVKGAGHPLRCQDRITEGPAALGFLRRRNLVRRFAQIEQAFVEFE